jgi:hypothetical protein
VNLSDWIGSIAGLVGAVTGIAAWVRSGTANRHAGNAVDEARTANVVSKDAVSEAKASNVIAKESNVFAREAVDAAKESNGIAREANEISRATSDEERKRADQANRAQIVLRREDGKVKFFQQSMSAGQKRILLYIVSEGRAPARDVKWEVWAYGKRLNLESDKTRLFLPDAVESIYFQPYTNSETADEALVYAVTITYRDGTREDAQTIKRCFRFHGSSYAHWRAEEVPCNGQG